jgi:hypothetical protein
VGVLHGPDDVRGFVLEGDRDRGDLLDLVEAVLVHQPRHAGDRAGLGIEGHAELLAAAAQDRGLVDARAAAGRNDDGDREIGVEPLPGPGLPEAREGCDERLLLARADGARLRPEREGHCERRPELERLRRQAAPAEPERPGGRGETRLALDGLAAGGGDEVAQPLLVAAGEHRLHRTGVAQGCVDELIPFGELDGSEPEGVEHGKS